MPEQKNTKSRVYPPLCCVDCANYKTSRGKEGPGCSEDQDPNSCKLYLPIEVIEKVEKVWTGKPNLP